MWPIRRNAGKIWPSPFMVAKCARYLTYPLRMTVSSFRDAAKAIGRCTGSQPRRDEEDGPSEPKSARDEALDGYRKLLEDTFNRSDEKYIDSVMFSVRPCIYYQ